MRRCGFLLAMTCVIFFAVPLWAADLTPIDQQVAKVQNDPVKVLSVSGSVHSLSWSPDRATLAVLTQQNQGQKDQKSAIRLDRLSSHMDPQVAKAVRRTGARIWHLPPYSHDFNPIEKMWSKIKA